MTESVKVCHPSKINLVKNQAICNRNKLDMGLAIRHIWKLIG